MNNKEWNDWKWQVKNSIKRTVIGNEYEMKVTPYYEKLIDCNDEKCPIKQQCVPSDEECKTTDYNVENIDIRDFLNEEKYSPVTNLVHRYKDKVLLLVTNQCFMNCRFCTRKRVTSNPEFESNLKKAFEYIKEHTEIKDVLISGGDPLTLDDKKIEKILKEIRNIEHIDIIRIGTRAPVVLPMRITEDLVNMIRKYQPVWINTHFNTYKEITEDSKEACRKIVDAGIPLGNQSVLLKNVNDSVDKYKKLCTELVKIRVRPYYLYQCDVGRGLDHFRTKIEVGINIINEMRKSTTGFAILEYIIDSPNGGKLRIQKSNLLEIDDNKVTLENYDGEICVYPQGKSDDRK